MIIGAHQPNFMPWSGYFYKMMRCDKFILADDVQYTTHSYINRVWIKAFHGKQWLTVPVQISGKGLSKIKEIKIAPSQIWKHKHWHTLHLNYKHAPYFDQYAGYFEKLYQKKWTYLVDLNFELISFFTEALDITCSISRSSEFAVPESPTKRIVELVKKSGGSKYLSGETGRTYLDESQFLKEGIDLKYTNFKTSPYRQQFSAFLPNLSIIDLLFNEGPQSKTFLLKSGKIIDA